MRGRTEASQRLPLRGTVVSADPDNRRRGRVGSLRMYVVFGVFCVVLYVLSVVCCGVVVCRARCVRASVRVVRGWLGWGMLCVRWWAGGACCVVWCVVHVMCALFRVLCTLRVRCCAFVYVTRCFFHFQKSCGKHTPMTYRKQTKSYRSTPQKMQKYRSNTANT